MQALFYRWTIRGYWVLGADELKKSPNDYFTKFVSAGPKTYALKSLSGRNDICMAKGFTISYKNAQIMNFDNLREQVLHKAFNGEFLDPTTPPNTPQVMTVWKKQKSVDLNSVLEQRNRNYCYIPTSYS